MKDLQYLKTEILSRMAGLIRKYGKQQYDYINRYHLGRYESNYFGVIRAGQNLSICDLNWTINYYFSVLELTPFAGQRPKYIKEELLNIANKIIKGEYEMKERFVSIGEKEKGKIIKNEMYSIIGFMDKVGKNNFPYKYAKIPLLTRLSNKKLNEYIFDLVDQHIEEYYLSIMFNIGKAIDKDKKGRK